MATQIRAETDPYAEEDRQLAAPKAMALPSHLQGTWRQLSWTKADRVDMTVGEIEAIRPHLPSLLQLARAETTKAPHRDFMAAIALVMTLPSQAVSDELGDAAFMAYQIGVGDLPADLLMKAARMVLQDTTRRPFRPAPPELRSYVLAEFEERVARLDRLRSIEATPPRRYVPPPLRAATPAPRETTSVDVDALNEWGAPLGMKWDANGTMTRFEPRGSGQKPLEARERHTATPQAADYAEIRERVAVAVPPVSDASAGLRALAERLLSA